VGKHDQALKIMERLHNDPTDPLNAAAHAEFLQIRAQVEIDKEQKSGYIDMFRKPSWRKRSLLVIFIM
jgi:tRNA(Arg) A34 adenosine deaminase TadA